MAPAGAGLRSYPSLPEVAEIPPLPVNYVNQLVEEKFGVFLSRTGLEYPGLLSDFMLASMSDSSQGRFLKTISSPGFSVDARLNRLLSVGAFLLAKPPPGPAASAEAQPASGEPGVEPPAGPPALQPVQSASAQPANAQLAGAHMPHRRALIRFSRLSAAERPNQRAAARAGQRSGARGDAPDRSDRADRSDADAAPLAVQAASADQAWSISQTSYEHLGDFVYSNNTVRSQASTAPLASSSCSTSRPCNPGNLPPRGFYDLEVVISINPDLIEPAALCPVIFNLVQQAICRVSSFFDPTGSSSFLQKSLETRSKTTLYIASPNAVIHPCADQEFAQDVGQAGPAEAARARASRPRQQRPSQNVPDYGSLESTTIQEINPILAWHGILAALRLSLEDLTRYKQIRSLLDVVLQSSSYPDQFLLLHMLPAYFPRSEADTMFSTAWAVFNRSGAYLIGRGAGRGKIEKAEDTGTDAPAPGPASASSSTPASTPTPKPAMDTDTFIRSACNGRLIRASDSISGCFTASLTKASNQIVLYRSAPGRDSHFSEKLSETISGADLKQASKDGIVVSLSAPLSTAMPAYGVFANKISKSRPQKTVDALYWLVRLVGLYSGGPFLLVWFCGWPDALSELPRLVEGFPLSFFDRIRLVVVGASSGTRQSVLRSFLGGTLLAKGYSERSLRELYRDYPHLVFGAQVSEWSRESGKG